MEHLVSSQQDKTNQWERTTASANEAFHQQEFINAEKLYEYALVIAQNTFIDKFRQNAEKAVTVSVVSYLNLIDNHVAQRDIHSAIHVFEEGLSFLLSIGHAKTANSPQMHSLIKGYNRFRVECLYFLQQHSHHLTDFQLSHLKGLVKRSIFSSSHAH